MAGEALRGRPPQRRGHACRGRPPAGNRLFDCRRAAAVECEGGVCHPPYPAPCGTLRIYLSRIQRAVHLSAGGRSLAEQMGGQYPELVAQKGLIVSVIQEESAFLQVLKKVVGVFVLTLAIRYVVYLVSFVQLRIAKVNTKTPTTFFST